MQSKNIWKHYIHIRLLVYIFTYLHYIYLLRPYTIY